MRLSFIWALAAAATALSADRPVNPVFESRAALAPQGKIDQLVFDRLKSLDIQPAYPCSDAVFLRRAYLDVIGTLPTAQEAAAFLQDQAPNKRAALIDRLLERDEFADYWAMKWSDLLRVKAEFPINLWPNAAQAYFHWIRAAIRENKPYDQFVRELLTASGSNFRNAPVNFYRAMQSKDPSAIAQTVALTFMGTRAENWPKARLTGMAWILRAGRRTKRPASGRKRSSTSSPPLAPVTAIFPDGTPAKLVAGRDPREAFADWLITPKNPWFTRNIVNRVWSWLLGRGIIQEPDDIRARQSAGEPRTARVP